MGKVRLNVLMLKLMKSNLGINQKNLFYIVWKIYCRYCRNNKNECEETENLLKNNKDIISDNRNKQEKREKKSKSAKRKKKITIKKIKKLDPTNENKEDKIKQPNKEENKKFINIFIKFRNTRIYKVPNNFTFGQDQYLMEKNLIILMKHQKILEQKQIQVYL